MANYFQEGQTSTGNSDNETVRWLKTNNLSHLIPIFENGLSLSELAEMREKELTEILEAMGLNKIDIIRVKSKIIKFNEQSQPPSPPKPQSKPHRVIVTEVETTALNSLDEKHKQLTAENKSIQDRLSEFEAEYRKQEKFIHDTFNELQSNIEKRKNILLNELRIKSDEYRRTLSAQMKSVANQRSILGKIKQKCENDIHHSNVSSLAQATQRANKTVALIDETLLSLDKSTVITKGVSITCDIAKREINDNIKTWGVVSMIGDKPPVPTINIVTLHEFSMAVELMTDPTFHATISKYEMQIEQKEQTKRNPYHRNAALKDDMKGDDVSIVNIHGDNIAFHLFSSLIQKTEYQIRARCLLQNGQRGEWSEWLAIRTPFLRDPSSNYAPAIQLNFGLNTESLTMNDWLTFCSRKNVALTPYQKRRIFYYMKAQLSGLRTGNGSKIASIPIRLFNAFVRPHFRFHCDEWKNMQREIREKGAKRDYANSSMWSNKAAKSKRKPKAYSRHRNDGWW